MNPIEPLKTVQWLDLVKARTGALTDADLARKLGVKKQTISAQRLGKHTQEPLQALRTARLLELCPIVVIAAACWERAKDETVKLEWALVYHRNGGGLLIAHAKTGQINLNCISTTAPCQFEKNTPIC